MTAQEINTKIELSEVAIDLYIKDGSFTIGKLVDASGYNASEIYNLFPNKKSILEFYYLSLVLQYEAMISEIDDFESYSISEKISNFIFTSFDMMGERKAFVESTFEPMIFQKGSRSEFHTAVTSLLKHFFTTDPEVSVSAAFLMKDYFYSFIAREYLHIIRFWLDDDSDGKERSFALTDKLTGFLQELIYNKAIDKGFDLFKYLVAHAGLGSNIPFVGDWISEWAQTDSKQNHE